ncbi:MAG TPA: hypothetical protein VL947_07070 [Cytophagales bacterium]|nr:hypothetical protein [Cytophagales bacterium]
MAGTNKQDKEAAYALFMVGFKQTEISRVLGRTEATISAWVKDGDWVNKRTEKRLFRENAEDKIQNLIGFQLDVLDKIRINLQDSLEETENVQELEKLLIKRGDIDALQKLFTTIKDEKELDWKAKVKLLNRLTEDVANEDNRLAKSLLPHITEFLNKERQQDFKNR